MKTANMTIKVDGVVYDPELAEEKLATKVMKWYDRHVRSWEVYSQDDEGNQVGNSTYVYTRKEADNEIARRLDDMDIAARKEDK